MMGLFGRGKREILTENRARSVAALMRLEHGKEEPPPTPLGGVSCPEDGSCVSVYLVPDGSGLSYACRCSWDGREVRVPVGHDRHDGEPWFETAMATARDLAITRIPR